MAGGGKGSLDRRKYAADALRAARKSKSNDFLDRLDGGTGRPPEQFLCFKEQNEFPPISSTTEPSFGSLFDGPYFVG